VRQAPNHVAIADHVERCRRIPLDVERLDGVAQPAQPGKAAADIVVGETDQPALVVGNQAVQLLLAGDDVPYYRLHRARLEARALPGEYAEFATERASSRCFQRQRMQGAAGEQLETRCRDRTAVVGRALVAGAQTIGTEVPINLWNGGLRIADDDGIEIGRAQARVAAGESTAEHRLGAASAPVMGKLARAVEVRMQRRNE